MNNLKKSILLLVIILIFNSITAQNSGYNIQIKLNNMPALTNDKQDTAILGNYFADMQLSRDTAFSKNGVFIFSDNKPLERGMYFFYIKEQGYYDFTIDNNQFFKVEIQYKDFKENDAYKNMSVVGNKENNDNIIYFNFLNSKGKIRYNLMEEYKNSKDEKQKNILKDQIGKIENEVNEYKENYIKTHPKYVISKILMAMKTIDVPNLKKPNGQDDTVEQYKYYREHFFDNVDWSEDALIRSPLGILVKKVEEYTEKLTSQDPDSLIKACDYIIKNASASRELEKYFIWKLTQKYETSKVMCQDRVFIHLAQNYYCKGRAWWVDSSTLRKICDESAKMSYSSCGNIAPNIMCSDTIGNMQELHKVDADFTILVFWDPTCGHCQKVMPIIANIVKKHSDKKWKVYAKSSESKKDEWKKYLNEHPETKIFINTINSTNYLPWAENFNNYNIISNPVIFVLDKNKKIIAKRIDENKLEEFLLYLEDEKKTKK